MYLYSVTVPPNTLESDPIVERCKVSAGILTRLMVFFPPGPAALVRVRIFYQGAQIEPWNRDGWFAWDSYIFDLMCEHTITAPDTELEVQGWSEDDSIEHTVGFGFGVESPAEDPIAKLVDTFSRMMGGGKVKA